MCKWRKIITHFNYCARKCNQQEDRFIQLWESSIAHWEESKGLSDGAVFALTNFIKKEAKDIFLIIIVVVVVVTTIIVV